MTGARGAGTAGARRHRTAVIVAAAGLVLAVDQITKTLAVQDLTGHPVHLLGPLSLALAYNTGAAFSLGTGAGLPIVVLGSLLLVAIIWFGRRSRSMVVAVATGSIIGGALGNISDRILRGDGGVVDFIHTGVWPTFNVADSAVVVGCAALFVSFWRAERALPASSRRGARYEDGAPT